MTKLMPHMYSICQDEAKKYGPRSMTINGKCVTAYILTRGELHTIFRKNGFKRDGVAWLHYVQDFRDVMNVEAPSDRIILNPNENWAVAFKDVTKSEYLDLQFAAEELESPVLAVEP